MFLTPAELAELAKRVKPLDELRSLRDAEDCGDAGVYFLWFQDVLQYVGRSWCISNRIQGHHTALRFSFDRATCIAIPIPDQTETPQLNRAIDDIESAYIRKYQPRCNGKGVFRSVRVSV